MANTLSFTERKRVRKNFGKLKEVSKFPNLIEIQKKSYEDFLLEYTNPSERPDKGLQKVFKGVFPLEDFSGSARIDLGYTEVSPTIILLPLRVNTPCFSPNSSNP